jgi:hypothetical protein
MLDRTRGDIDLHLRASDPDGQRKVAPAAHKLLNLGRTFGIPGQLADRPEAQFLPRIGLSNHKGEDA